MKLSGILPDEQSIPETMNILTYELGSLVRCVHYGRRDLDVTHSTYMYEGKKEMGDTITMLRLLCEQLGWDFYECFRQGEENFRTKMEDVKSTMTFNLPQHTSFRYKREGD